MRCVFRILALLSVLCSKEFSHWDCYLASGFEISSRSNHPKRISRSANENHRAINNIDERPRCKYDLGLGGNEPFESKDQGDYSYQQSDDDQRQLYKDTDNGLSSDVYEACRFLVEYEATRMYPAPIKSDVADSTDLGDKSIANRHSTSTTTKVASTKGIQSSISNNAQKRNWHGIESTNEKSTTASTKVTERTNRRKRLAKVQPKRHLEDCLTIFDHAKSGSSAKSIIWSRPDTPQLDMNSVWVEMLLHHQTALSQSRG
mmetsp:Transcript_22372/g.53229  ORF Transcript_22372/g.53229 Transcript_22372/m.53229 type:complete len:260 (+) Transcript_22372:95-874(+)|eukprot:CAMPEP_0197184408 /NCGR_PEP_ID=MMETSP1423-20130617/9814_1 /TAXON_ID=476441 /ORGANISM="Pseudo-nitzschia heimii, Strain UNC1101" /LENGTH=259 /DNA_ID=CAMNT_0042635209 /DNA_START=86 /DNA_END=865 /DNA_ORIENTATION=+